MGDDGSFENQLLIACRARLAITICNLEKMKFEKRLEVFTLPKITFQRRVEQEKRLLF